MLCKIRIDENSPKHTKLTIFMNGVSCGRLIMESVEAFVFISALTDPKTNSLTVEVENIYDKI